MATETSRFMIHRHAVGMLLVLLLALARSSAAAAEPEPPAGTKDAKEKEGEAKTAAKKADGDNDNDDGDDDDGPRLRLSPGIEVFAGAAALIVVDAEDDWQPEFVLSRAFLWLDASYERARARVTLESVYSTSGASLLGVGGNSIVLRLREAWVAYNPWDFLEFQVGLVKTLAHPYVEDSWRLRVVDRVGIERQALAPPSDLGIVVRGHLPGGYGTLAIGAYNGDGYMMRELNRDKNIEFTASIHPLADIQGAEPFNVLLSYTLGTEGASSSRANRLHAGLLWDGKRIGAGATFTWVWGLDGLGDREGYLISGFLRGEPVDNLLLAFSGSHFRRDVDFAAASISTVMGAVGYRFIDPLSLFLSVDRQFAASAAKAANPGADVWTIALTAKAFFHVQ